MDIKTVDIQRSSDTSSDPLFNLRRESTERMRTALLSTSLENPRSVAAAVQQVTILRVSHQVTRIVQYLDMMDKIEENLYKALDKELERTDFYDPSEITKLMAIQSKLQETIIESNKLLAPYLDMEYFPAFDAIETITPVDDEILELSSSKRNELRETAGAILSELESMTTSDKSVKV